MLENTHTHTHTHPHTPEGKISAAMIWGGGNMKSGREKGGNVKKKEERGKKKRKWEVKVYNKCKIGKK
jgi:hypothetical protein